MSFARRRLLKRAVFVGAALVLAQVVSAGDGAFAQRRPAAQATPGGRPPACWDGCFSQCQSIGSSAAVCSRTCYAQCSGIVGNSDNRH
jgi:hypothetical protein